MSFQAVSNEFNKGESVVVYLDLWRISQRNDQYMEWWVLYLKKLRIGYKKETMKGNK